MTTKDRAGNSVSRQRVTNWLYPTLTFIGFILLWQASVVTTGIHAIVLPPPTAVIARMASAFSVLSQNTFPTILAIVVGFIGAIIIGVPLAILIAASRNFEKSFYPLLLGSQGVPKVALAPIFIVWFGFGFLPKILIAMLIAFFPVVIDTVAGLRSIDPGYIHLARSMGASRIKIYWRLLLPNALPHMFAGFKVAMALAIVGAIVGEMVGANNGLGYILVVANGNLDMALVFATLVWLVVVSLILTWVIELIERIALPWSRQSRNEHFAHSSLPS
jgi:NitT/TauT family transport system permease protein